MSLLTMPDTKILNRIDKKFDKLVDSHNCNIKTFFVNSYKKGYSPEFMGQYFESSLEYSERKEGGQFYTPKTIVEYMISHLNITKNSTVLDPACGCGSFLLTTYNIFKEKFSTEFLKNIFGVDINYDAVKVTRACLYMQSNFDSSYIDVIKNHINYGNSIVTNQAIDKNAFNWQVSFDHVMKRGGFDFIIGNPPYVTLNKNREFDPA